MGRRLSARDGVRVRDGPLGAQLAAELVDDAHALDRIADTDGDLEAHERDLVATFGIVFGPDADGHCHAESLDGRTMVLVVAAEPAGDATEEPVVDGSVDRPGCLPQGVEWYVEGLVRPLEPSLGHDGRVGGEHGPDEPGDRSRGRRGVARSRERVA